MSQLFYSAFPGGKHTIHEIFEVDLLLRQRSRAFAC